MQNTINPNLYPLLVSTSDIEGGAARAAYRLHQGLQHIAVNSQMLSYRKTSGDPTVHKRSEKLTFQQTKLSVFLDKYPLQLYRHRQRAPYWSLNWFPNAVTHEINTFYPNVVHLHWVGNGFLPIPSLETIKAPIVWTLHDMWAFTGGCHYSGECNRYEGECGQCPQLGTRQKRDLSHWVWQRKAKHWADLNLTIVTPSRWLADCARASRLFQDTRIEVIPNGLDLDQYKPHNTSAARELLGLPQDRKLILAGANEGLKDTRKGVAYLKPALKGLSETWRDKADLVVFGSTKPLEAPDFGLKAHYTGHLGDDVTLALLYAAVDVFVAPSLQDNLPNTIMEALACGTPCVAFNIGGMPDMIDQHENGYLAEAFSVHDLQKGIDWVLCDDARHAKLAHHARKSVEERYKLTHIAQQYADLYAELIDWTTPKIP